MIPKRNSFRALTLATALLALAPAPARAEGAPADAPPTATARPAAPPASPAEVQALVARLGAEDWAEREAATRRLTEIGPVAHEALRAALASGDAEVRYRARLVLRAPLRTVKRLLDQLQRTGGGREDEAFRAIVALGDEAVDPLVYVIARELGDYEGKNDDRVRVAFDCLDQIGSGRAVEPLLGLLDKNLQRFTGDLAKALQRSGEAEAKKGLMARGASAEPGVRKAAVETLALFRGEDVVAALARALRDPDVAVRMEAVEALRQLASRGSKTPAAARPRVGGAIIQIGGGQIVLRGRNGRLRIVNGNGLPEATAHALGPKKPPSDEDRRLSALAADAILGALDDDHDQVQLIAIRALAALDDRRAIPRLVKVLESGAEDERTLAAIEALARFEVREAVPRVTRLLDSARGDIAEASAVALGRLKARDAVPALLAKLVTQTASLEAPPVTQQAVIESLCQIGDPRAFEPLRAYFETAEGLRPYVCMAVGHLPGPGPRAWLLERARRADDIPTSTIALEQLEERGDEGMLGDDEAVEEAALAFLESRAAPKDEALRLLGRRGWKPAYEAVARLLQQSPETDVQLGAIRALGELGDRRAIAVLRPIHARTSADDRVHEVATIALSKLGDAGVLQPSIEEWKKRAEAAKGTGRADGALTELGILHLYRHDYAAAETCFAQIIEQCKVDGRVNDVASYNLACTYSLMGRTAEAVEWLRRAMGEGFRDWKHVDGDTDLDAIRDTSEFRAVREEMIRLGAQDAQPSEELIFGGDPRIRFRNGTLLIEGADDEADAPPDEEDPSPLDDEAAPAPAAPPPQPPPAQGAAPAPGGGG